MARAACTRALSHHAPGQQVTYPAKGIRVVIVCVNLTGCPCVCVWAVRGPVGAGGGAALPGLQQSSADDREGRRDLDRLVERLHLRRWTPEEREEYLGSQVTARAEPDHRVFAAPR